jgi:hypothetical protein
MRFRPLCTRLWLTDTQLRTNLQFCPPARSRSYSFPPECCRFVCACGAVAHHRERQTGSTGAHPRNQVYLSGLEERGERLLEHVREEAFRSFRRAPTEHRLQLAGAECTDRRGRPGGESTGVGLGKSTRGCATTQCVFIVDKFQPALSAQINREEGIPDTGPSSEPEHVQQIHCIAREQARRSRDRCDAQRESQQLIALPPHQDRRA